MEQAEEVGDAVSKIGPTGDFPRGKFNASDEGALRIAVGTQGDCVVIGFGKEVAWLAMPKGQAMALASLIVRHAADLPDDHPTPQ